MSSGGPLLRVNDVMITFRDARLSTFLAVDGRVGVAQLRKIGPFSFDVHRGESVALVGPSGCGKTSLALALMGLLPESATVTGSIRFDGAELLTLRPRQWVAVRSQRIALISQDPAGWLDPVQRVDDQIAEAVRVHHRLSRRASRQRAHELLAEVGFPVSNEKGVLRSFPYQLSGGMQQRIAIAMALAGEPDLLIADEPTSALDATVQVDVLDALERARTMNAMALLLITHDFAVTRYLRQRVVDVRSAVTANSFAAALTSTASSGDTISGVPSAAQISTPAATYGPTPSPTSGATRVDVSSVDRELEVRNGPEDPPLLQGRSLHKSFGRRLAVDGVDIEVEKGEIVGIVGETGSGKTTLARMLTGLLRPDAGTVRLLDLEISSATRKQQRGATRRVQLVFQNQYGSLDPRMTIGRLVEEPLRVHRLCTRETSLQIDAVLHSVGIDPSRKRSYPVQLSGGERQRVSLARALILRPELIVLDEPLSGLDADLRDDVIALLVRLREEYALSYLVIAHDLAAIRALSDRVIVMRDGRIIEEGATETVLNEPSHPYTRRLIEASLDRIDP